MYTMYMYTFTCTVHVSACTCTCNYLSLPHSGTCPVTPSGDEPTPTGNQYLLIAPPSKTRPDHKETCLLKDRSKPNTPQSPTCVTPPKSPSTIDPIFESLKSQFTASQIQALVEMLAKMNDKGGGESEVNVGYLVTKTANKLNESM